MNNQTAKTKLTQAIMLPILGLLIAGIVGVIAVPEIAQGTSANDMLMVTGFAVLLVASIFGGSILWAANLTLTASKHISPSTGQPLEQVSGAKTLAFVMHIIWLSINGIFWWTILMTYNLSYMFSGMFDSEQNANPRSDMNPLTVVPLVLLAAMLVGVHLLVMDVRARTATAPKPVWQAPFPPVPPQAPQAPTQG